MPDSSDLTAPGDLRGHACIQTYLKTLTSSPGVYRMLDSENRVLYVGKARNLKARVSNYARPAGHAPRIARMIAEELLLMRVRLSEAGWGLGQQQSVYRQAIKDLCAYGIVTVFDLLDDAQLQDVVRESFLRCEMKLKRDVPQPGQTEDQGKTNRLIGAVRYLLSGSSEPAADERSA